MFSLTIYPKWILRLAFYVLPLVTCYNGQSQPKDAANQFKRDTARINKLDRLAKKQKNRDSAILLYNQKRELSIHIRYPDGVASALMGIGLLYCNSGDFPKALKYISSAEPYCRNALFNKEILASCYNNKGLVYFYQSDYVAATENYHTALKEIKKAGEDTSELSALIYNNLATIQICMIQYDQAIKYLDQGEQIARKGGFYQTLTMLLCNKGLCYSELKQPIYAVRYLNQALAVAKKINNMYLQTGINVNVGDILIKDGKNNEAISYYKEAIRISNRAALTPAAILASYSLGTAYYNQKKYLDAESILVPAVKNAEAIKFREDIENGYNILCNVYKATHQYAKASSIQDTLLMLKDSLMSTEKTKAINSLEIRYRTSEKDKQLAVRSLQLAEQEKNIAKKNLQIGGISAGAIMLSMSIIWLYRRDSYKASLQKEQIRTLQHEQEIGQLKAMVRGEEKERARIASELHDSIVGQLAAIRMNFSAIQHEHKLEHINDYEDALQQLSDASDDVRKTAHNLMPGVLLQGGLNAAVEHYCRKMAKGIEINFQHFGELPRMDPDFELSAYRIVQELVQNVIKHAQAKKAIVQINYNNSMLSITVEDNGKGMKTAPEGDSSSGFGLKNLSTRVKAFNGHMEVESGSDGGTVVYVEFEVGELGAEG